VSDHRYECTTCGNIFAPPDEYNDDPQSRVSVCCGTNPVKYLGYVGKVPYVQSDNLGLQGVLNPADGKMYDSKSAYYRAVKDAGCVVLGDDAPTQAAKPKQKPINWEKAVAETLKTTPVKGKR
jgi:hypothetical protein